jgi:N utilization substance protein B
MTRSDERRAAIFQVYQDDVRRELHGEPADLVPFARELVEGVAENRERLDQVIAANSIGWEVDRIAPLERAILRVALFEILHRPDIPVEVSIDEAVEAAKQYCGKDAPGFVNGILGSAIKEGST